MEMSKANLPIFGLTLALGVIVSTFILANAVQKSVPSNQVVKVRGVAEEFIDLDRVDWEIKIQVQDFDLKTAYSKVDQSYEKVVEFLKLKGIDLSKMTHEGYQQYKETQRKYLDKNGNYKDEFLGWVVNRNIQIKDAIQLDLVEKLSKSFGAEIQKSNVSASSQSPFYYVSSDPVELKKRLLEKAAANAYFRASLIAKNSRSSLGGLKAARQGDYTGLTYDGKVGGSTRRHRVTALVTVDYSLK